MQKFVRYLVGLGIASWNRHFGYGNEMRVVLQYTSSMRHRWSLILMTVSWNDTLVSIWSVWPWYRLINKHNQSWLLTCSSFLEPGQRYPLCRIHLQHRAYSSILLTTTCELLVCKERQTKSKHLHKVLRGQNNDNNSFIYIAHVSNPPWIYSSCLLSTTFT